MADKRITELNLHTSLVLSDVIAIVNSGETKKTTYGTLYYGIRDGLVSGSSQITIGDTTGFTEFSSSLSASIALGTNEQDLSNYALISGGNEFIGDQTISGSLFVSGGTELGGNIFPTTPQGATLGTIDKPFRDIFLQSGSISIESDTPGDPSAIISNKDGNLEISVGGMLLVQPDASFIAPTGSFSYLSGSFNHIGSANRLGDTIVTGSVDITGSFTSSLTEGHFFVGNGDNKTQEFPTSSFVQTTQTGSLVQSAYISCYSTSSISLVTSGSEQAIDFTSIWTENGISLVDNNKFTFAEPGVYKLEFLTTIENDTNDEQDSWFWIKLNGNNFPNSATKVTVRKRKSNGEHTHQLVSISILGVAQTAGDYVQLYWTGEDTALGMPYEGATGVHPAAPSVTLNIIRVG
jgi:hypothetical protein